MTSLPSPAKNIFFAFYYIPSYHFFFTFFWYTLVRKHRSFKWHIFWNYFKRWFMGKNRNKKEQWSDIFSFGSEWPRERSLRVRYSSTIVVSLRLCSFAGGLAFHHFHIVSLLALKVSVLLNFIWYFSVHVTLKDVVKWHKIWYIYKKR